MLDRYLSTKIVNGHCIEHIVKLRVSSTRCPVPLTVVYVL